MRTKKNRFLADPSLSREEMEKIQREIGEEAIFEDYFDFSMTGKGLTVMGVDQAFLEENMKNGSSSGAENPRFSTAVSGAVVIEEGEVVEKEYGVSDIEMPYIPGLLAFREAPSIVEALAKIESKPDIVFFDGSGRIHFRQAGIATHMGLLFDVPSIGIAKNLLCGRTAEPVDSLQEGEKVPVFADSSVEVEDDTLIGYAYQSRQYPDSTKINPLYISSGHRVSADTAVGTVEKHCSGYKLPEPTRLADKYVGEIKEEVQS